MVSVALTNHIHVHVSQTIYMYYNVVEIQNEIMSFEQFGLCALGNVLGGNLDFPLSLPVGMICGHGFVM